MTFQRGGCEGLHTHTVNPLPKNRTLRQNVVTPGARGQSGSQTSGVGNAAFGRTGARAVDDRAERPCARSCAQGGLAIGAARSIPERPGARTRAQEQKMSGTKA